MLESLNEGQYGSDEENYVPDNYSEDAWMPAVSPHKEKMFRTVRNGQLDITKYRKEQIKDAIYKVTNLIVGEFLIHITEYHGMKAGNKPQESKLNLDIILYRTKYKTETGQHCNMQFKLDPRTDNRFTGKPWLEMFAGSRADNIPVDTLVDIIRWLQALKRINAFL
ncbi:unnamed protein product [Sphagnum balticum]